MNLVFTLYEGFIEIVLAMYLNYLGKVYISLGDKISYVYGLVLIPVCLVILPLYMLYIVTLSAAKL